ncbi:alginate lyase family protein [Amycolatopsis benzoatilytica]|uniref:alginate lyase family protein n=1 Tax=Amycolatopsis benzoatilytica TaxID=346045 RepID=UPI000374ABA2|nr:alginate lyase family protein [Amycolatopsis benzoatilytica]
MSRILFRRALAALGAVPLTFGLCAAPAVAAPFVHPGVLVSKNQLDFVRDKVKTGAQPWKAASEQMLASPYASLSRQPKPRADVDCGSRSNPNNGCTDERQDAIAAYTDALAWYVTQDSRYAEKSVAIMDAWSATITEHTNSNAPLQTGWAGASWARAGELIKATYQKWPNEAKFAAMLRNVYLPTVAKGSNSNGNWELVMMEAAVGISVFLDDRASYDAAMTRYRDRAAAYVYLPSDGALPHTTASSGLKTKAQIVKYWQGQSTFTAGLAQETCRDFTHTGYGLASIADIAETSRIQGADLYSTDIGKRLQAGFEFQAKYELGARAPASLCGGKLNLGLGPVTEVAYNALHGRMGAAMPETGKLTDQDRPEGTNTLFVAWETLTHAGNPG